VRPKGRRDPNQWWVTLATFERSTASQEILPEWAQGACGWIACRSVDDEESVRDLLARGLRYCGLRLLEIDNVRTLNDEDDADEIDEHLASNMREAEAGASWVWGTLHCYRADGEA
jgi:hypothetical protein